MNETIYIVENVSLFVFFLKKKKKEGHINKRMKTSLRQVAYIKIASVKFMQSFG